MSSLPERRRRSSRDNIGVPPRRYGQDEEVQVYENVKEQSNVEKNSVKSTSISSSKQSSARMREIDRKEREMKMELLKLQLESIQEEKESLRNTSSRGSIKTQTSQSKYDITECFSERGEGDEGFYIEKWVKEAEKLRGEEFSWENPKKGEITSVFSSANYPFQKVDALSDGKPTLEYNQVEMNNFPTMLTKCLENLSSNIEKLVSNKHPLPDFHGDINEFPFWISEFQRSTKDYRISAVDNLNRLHKCLKGKARETVQDLFCSPENVDFIIDTLKINFGRDEWIIMSLMEKARKCPSQREDSLEPFMHFSAIVSNMVIAMSSTKRTSYLENPELLYRLEEKLPPNSRRAWAHIKVLKEQLKETVNLKHFADWIKTEVNLLMSINVPSQFSSKPSTVAQRKERTLSISGKEIEMCKFCEEQSHRLYNCKRFLALSVEERRKYVVENRLCFRCLIFGHSAVKCFRNVFCNIGECRGRHNRLLHEDKGIVVNNDENETKFTGVVGRSSSILKMIKILIYGHEKQIETCALLDEGSTVTLIDADVAASIDLKGPEIPVCLQWTNDVTHRENDSKLVNFDISNTVNTKKRFKIRNARTIKNLALPRQNLDVDFLSQKYKYIDKSILESIIDCQPKILIGQDNVFLITSQEVIQPSWDAPAMSKTKLGWVVHGPYPEIQNEETLVKISLCQHDETYLQEIIENNLKLEEDGITDDREFSKDERKALEIMKSTIKRVGNKFEIGLPWKKENVIFPETKLMAMKRLICMEKKMDQDNQFAKAYCDKIKEYLKKGYAEQISAEEELKDTGKIWYLPHFAVKNINKPDKIRFVFDAAAKSSNVNLNDFLFKGPDFNSLLVAIIWRFRERKYAFAGDISEMFHQVTIQKEDRGCQRFLFRDLDRNREPDVFQMRVMIFGAICSPSIAQFVKNENAREFQNEFPDIMRIMTQQHYVDDYLDCKDTIEDSIKTIKDVIEVHCRGGFKMVNWMSNSEEILLALPESYRSQNNILNLDSHGIERVLGLHWNTKEDTLIFDTRFKKLPQILTNGEKIPTKREILKVVMTIFDPVGFLAPLVIQGKLIMQESWSERVNWDDEISDTIFKKWKSWCNSLKMMETLKIPRCYFKNVSLEVSLHVFSDASSKAFCSVAYFQCISEGNIEVSLVASKCKLAPLNKITSVPRLELQGAVLASRLSTSIQKETNYRIREVTWWTDSEIVLNWLNTRTKRLKTYEAHRVQEIEKSTQIRNWRWVPTNMNPADLATKETKGIELSTIWLEGPQFLKESAEYWPKNFVINETQEETEIVTSIRETSLSLPDPSRFSKWLRMIRTTAWMQRFCKNMKMSLESPTQVRPKIHQEIKGRKNLDNILENFQLEGHELDEAEKIWWKSVQERHFEKEIQLLRNNEYPEKNSKLHDMSPFLDNEGIVRMNSRIEFADVSYNIKYPIILPAGKEDPVVRLLIQHYHEELHHFGHETLLNNLRLKFWIINLRQTVKSTVRNCQFCKIKKAKPFQPEMAPLPESRLKGYGRPFSYCGLDYFGPLLVKVKRSVEKRYGALFTCFNTRAIHIELASSLTTDSALMAIHRFMGRRGQPIELHSDNGSNFIGAENEMKKSLLDMNQGKIIESLSKFKIKWVFNTPAAPFMGGVWERMIRSVKKVLYIILKEQHPSEELLRTLLTETESIVNSRPISYFSEQTGALEALTPMHFLIGTANTTNVPGIFTASDLFGRKQWKIAQVMAERFWVRWSREYVPLLRKRKKWFQKGESLRVGDIVAFADSKSKNKWILGRVSDVFPGRDGQIRSVQFTTKDGMLVRPVNSLLKLEVGEC